MQKNNQPFRERILSQMRANFKDQLIIEQQAQQIPQPSIYVVEQGTSLDLTSVRQLVESGRKMSNEQVKATVLRIYNYMVHLLTVLENNQKCRLNWKGGNVRGRSQRQNKIDLKSMQTKKVMLARLLEQCKHCISSKSQLLNFISSKKKEIFGEVNTAGLLCNLRQVYLLENYQHYSLIEDITEEKYLQQYDWLLQKLLHYHNFLKVYLENKVDFSKLNQRLCCLVRPDQINVIGTKMMQLIKFTLKLNLIQVKKAKNIIESVLTLKKNLIEAVLQAYYLGFMLKNEVQKMQDTLKKIQQTLVENIKSLKVNAQKAAQTNKKLSFLDNFDQTVSNKLSKKIEQVQYQFNNIYNFIDNQKGNLFARFYSRKLNKRMIRLTKIEHTLTNIYKILNNADYAESIWLQQQKRARLQKRNVAIQQKMKELASFKKEIKFLNQMHFKLIFEEIQRVSIFVHQQQGFSHWNHQLIDFQISLIKQCLFDSDGRRIKKQQSLSPNLSKSRIISNLSKQDVFGETILEIIAKSESLHASRVHNQQQFDKYAAVKEARDYFQEINVDIGESLLDQVHFKAHFLPKLIRKLQKAFQMTPYSEQPLNLQISHLLQSLKLLPYIIKTEVNQKKLNFLVFPKPNLPLLNQLKDVLFTHQQTLVKVCSQINNNPIRKKAIHQKILGFLESRLRFLFDLMEQLKKLDGVINVMQQSTFVKQSYQISQESTYNIILKLLLVQKQLKAYMQQDKDRKIGDSGYQSALELVNEQFLEYMIKSCSFLFQKDKNIFTPDLLSNLLELSEQAKSYISQSNQLISSTLSFLQENRMNKAISRIAQVSNKLNDLFLRLERVYVQAKKYSPIISSQQLKYELVRLQQFLTVLRLGSQTRHEIFDSRSKQLLTLIEELHF